MMRRFRILGLVLAVLLLLVPCFVLAEDAMAVTMPEECVFGENIPFTAQISENKGHLLVIIEIDGIDNFGSLARKVFFPGWGR